MGIQLPDEDYIKGAINEAEDALLRRVGYCFLLEIERSNEAGFVLGATRNDGARAQYGVTIPKEEVPRKLDAFQRVKRNRRWFKAELDTIVDSLCLGIVEGEPEVTKIIPPETEQRFAVAIVFGGRPDVVLTPERGVPADEAVRVYAAFVAGAAAIGGRPAMLPLGA